MEATAVHRPLHQFKLGLQAGVSIAIGYMPIALTYGFLAKTTGLTLSETLLMSLLVYAGAAQYMALDMIAKQIGVIEIIFTTFIVNIRHLLMAASLNEKVESDRPVKKALYAFGITDETFSVAAVEKGKLTTGYMFGLTIIAYLSWVCFSGLGFVVGASLPDIFQEGMSVALYAMFIGLLVPSMKANIKVVFLAVVAALFNCLFVFLEVLSSGWAIVLSTLLSALLVELIVWLKSEYGGSTS
ncbi:AzlC family ABC transporter permease [Caldibacillus lycopersici]|uniref:AzlC family ABC transporter permease n=1 Tax=Perspicuibacillus lycopersici TaxID=1325689 RepID=A0AAE3LPN6_9BACI|nr:AzlC family ABC transporter permease [Perspicuibacillus lycopersici]MCU9612489.1 AzlC family ABC transporter permease [Perspicuibacillus lycopersici]